MVDAVLEKGPCRRQIRGWRWNCLWHNCKTVVVSSQATDMSVTSQPIALIDAIISDSCHHHLQFIMASIIPQALPEELSTDPTAPSTIEKLSQALAGTSLNQYATDHS